MLVGIRYRQTDLTERTSQLEESLANAASLFNRATSAEGALKALRLEMDSIMQTREQELWAEQQVSISPAAVWHPPLP